MKLIDLTGQKFGRLTVLERAENIGNRVAWRCRCDCGNGTVVSGNSLKSGNTQSCGCLCRELNSKRLFQDLTGQTFGRLTVIEHAENHGKQTMWRCKCGCGVEKIVSAGALKSGNTQSCGCLAREKVTKHGMYHNSVYKIWRGMLDRCENENSTFYDSYGGRGIKVCARWHDINNFYADVSILPHFNEPGYSLDRIDNNGDYCPENVRWADKKTQNRNTRKNVFVEYNGEKLCLKDAAEISGINYRTLHNRYKRGLRGDELFKPVR